MYRMSLITMLAPPSLAARLDLPRCMKMCLVHDMAESLVGDITAVDGGLKLKVRWKGTEPEEALVALPGGSLPVEAQAAIAVQAFRTLVLEPANKKVEE